MSGGVVGWLVRAVAVMAVSSCALAPGWAQTAPKSGESRGAPPDGRKPAATLPNTTVVPRSGPEQKTATDGGVTGGQPQVSLVALLTDDGQRIDQGLIWRVYQDKPGPDGKNKLLSTHREAAPALRLAPGDYIVNAAFGRAHLTRKITVRAGSDATEQFVLNAGGLRLTAFINDGQPAPPNSVSYDVFSDERDQFANRTKIMGGAQPGLIIRLNSGIYHIVSTFGDANATVRADVTVEPGKLTEASVAHAAAKVTFKLVTRAGGEALAGTQWTVTTPQGEVVKESVGALATHSLAPGAYSVTARSGGRTFRRDFTLQMGDAAQVEVVMP